MTILISRLIEMFLVCVVYVLSTYLPTYIFIFHSLAHAHENDSCVNLIRIFRFISNTNLDFRLSK